MTPETCKSLLDSIKKHGQKQAVLGRQISGRSDHDVELVYGARRLFAARHLGIDLLVELRNIDDRSALVEMDIENRVRTDISAYERGLSYRRWLRQGHFSNQAEMAKHLAVSQAQVSRLLRFSELPTAIIDAFASPRDIREEWAIVLAKSCTDGDIRARIIRRARSCKSSTRRLRPHQVYDLLITEDSRRIIQPRPRDDVIKDSKGTPILRIGFRAKTVHLIFPRQNISENRLHAITKQVKDLLDPTLEVS